MKIPANTFNDAEDGDTSNLKLSLDPIETEATDWVFLDKKQHHVVGLSLETGSWNYRLEARDSSDQMTSTVFAVEVFPEEKPDNFNHYFRVVIDKEKDELLAEADGLVKLVRKLATSVSDDHDAPHVTVRSVREGSTVIEWSNNTLPTDVCAHASIDALESAMVSKNGKVKSEFQRRMGFHYPIASVETVLLGNCADAETPVDGDLTPTKGSIVPDSPEKKDNDVTTGKALDDDMLLSTVLPVIIIAVLLVVALVVACCLYRRNRSYKLAASKEAKSDYVSKGLPVVFPEEVGGRDDLATVTTPMLVKEERPPLVPPTFDATDVKRRSPSAAPDQRGMSAVSATTEHENPLYKPPPPIELTTTRSPRPKHTLPHQREPPPYVPP
jgi:neurexin